MTVLEQVREALRDESVQEKRMFGMVAFMVDGKLAMGVDGDGRMLVRVDPADDEALLRRPGARRSEMGAGRDMGPGWLRVDAEVAEDPAELRFWVATALDCNRRLPR
jgi:TfoX/Sxy family transcriptional regulator of competence genes